MEKLNRIAKLIALISGAIIISILIGFGYYDVLVATASGIFIFIIFASVVLGEVTVSTNKKEENNE